MVKIDTTKFTEEQEARFVAGWESAGGPIDDCESPTPWCCPWDWAGAIEVEGEIPEEWGADWYRQCKPEIDEILAENAKYEAAEQE